MKIYTGKIDRQLYKTDFLQTCIHIHKIKQKERLAYQTNNERQNKVK